MIETQTRHCGSSGNRSETDMKYKLHRINTSETIWGDDKHTQGPWRAMISEYYGEQPRVHAGDPRFEQLVCCVGNAEDWELASEEWEANARLIAAAPDLLNALRELCHRLGPRWFLENNWADPLASIAIAEGTSKSAQEEASPDPETHEFSADWYRPSSCMLCNFNRDHKIHITTA